MGTSFNKFPEVFDDEVLDILGSFYPKTPDIVKGAEKARGKHPGSQWRGLVFLYEAAKRLGWRPEIPVVKAEYERAVTAFESIDGTDPSFLRRLLGMREVLYYMADPFHEKKAAFPEQFTKEAILARATTEAEEDGLPPRGSLKRVRGSSQRNRPSAPSASKRRR